MRPALLLAAAALLWGTTGTAQALGPEGASPVAVGVVRLALGGLLLAVAGLRHGVPRDRRGARALLLSALAIVAYQPAFFVGVQRAGVALGTIVALGSAPAITGLLAWLVRRERPQRGWPLATLLAVAGCTLLVTAPGGQRVEPLGVLLALAAGTSYAVYALGAKSLLDRGWEPDTVMGAAFGAAALLALPLLPGLDLGWLAAPGGLAMALWLAVATMAVAYVLFGRGLAGLPAPTAATLSLAEPLTAALLGVLVLGERPGVTGLLGALLVLSGLLVLVSESRRAGGGREGAPTPGASHPPSRTERPLGSS